MQTRLVSHFFLGKSVVDANAPGLDNPQSTAEHFTLEQMDGVGHRGGDRCVGLITQPQALR
jgi:hypothetical protein